MVSRKTVVRLICYSVFAAVLLALIIFIFYKNSTGFRSSWIISYAVFFTLIIVIQNRRPEGEGTRVFDATLIGLILMTFIFLGSVALLLDIPIFNYVEPTILYGCYISLLLGLALGYFTGKSYTKKQLDLLDKNNEFRGVGSTKLEATTLLALTGFLLLCFLGVYLDLRALGYGLIVFAISGTFTLCVARFFQVRTWEGNTGKIVMMTKKRFYIKYKNLPINYYLLSK
jgi:hypothetical protein